MAVQISSEHCAHINARFVIRHVGEFGCVPCLVVTLDDECTGRLVELVGMRSEDTCRCLAKCQRQAMKQLVRAVPDVLVRADVKGRLKMIRKGLPYGAVYSVSANKEIAIAG